MTTITQAEISASRGNLLALLADRSCECFHRVVSRFTKPQPEANVGLVQQMIVHTEPHLDEYFAEVLFRACLPREKWQCGFEEQALFSARGDLGSQHLWANAATFGLPAAVGTTPAFYFDEHLARQNKIKPSASQVVADEMLSSVPPALATLLREVNAIDEYGEAHDQHLNNLIKTFHEARFFLGKDASGSYDVRDHLTPEWKRTVVDAFLAATLSCLAEGVDLVSDPKQKRKSLDDSLENYVARSPHRAEPRFAEASSRIKSTAGDQFNVFRDAILKRKDSAGRPVPLLDAAGNTIPQLLVLSRVCFAAEHCWGPKVRDLLATHLWEQEFQKQLDFYAVREAVEQLFVQKQLRLVTQVGDFTKEVMREIEVEVQDASNKRQPPRRYRKKCPVWVLSLTPAPGIIRPNKALSNFINAKNDGCGLILIRDAVLNTTAVFRCSGIPYDKWKRLVDEIVKTEGESIEPGEGNSDDCGCWHIQKNASGVYGPFILNGNKAHRYVPRSALDATALCELVKRTFYS